MYTNNIYGLNIILSDQMVIGPFEDWSKVRSPGRAARRRNRGIPQRIRVYYMPDPNLLRTSDSIIGHPATIQKLREKITKTGQELVRHYGTDQQF